MYICDKCLEEIRQSDWPLFFKGFDNSKCSRCECRGYVNDVEFDYIVGLNKKQQNKPMEKTLKMSVETARKFYQDNIKIVEQGMESSTIDWLLENFTKEELESKKGFTWEESFDGAGVYLLGGSIKDTINNPITSQKKDIFKTEKQALSALAFAQLSHICAKMNENTTQDKKHTYYTIIKCSPGFVGLQVSEVSYMYGTHLYFNRIEDARVSLNVNHDLWHQYWGCE